MANHRVLKSTGFFKGFDGTPIYYEVRGKGKPIVLCYGIACVMNHWTHQIKHFSENYQTIMIDYRGHHQTARPDDLKNLSLDAICRDIHDVCEHLGVEKASFWGHSYGVQLLLRFWELYPQRVDNFIFINGFSNNPIQGMFGTDLVPRVFELCKEIYKFYPQQFRGLWRAAVLNPLAIPLSALAGGFNLELTSWKNIEVYARGVASMDLDTFIHLFEQMMRYDATPVLKTIQVPTLVICGDRDGVTPVRYQKALHEGIRGSEFCLVKYGSHCTQLDLPEFVNLRIEKFLSEHHYQKIN